MDEKIENKEIETIEEVKLDAMPQLLITKDKMHGYLTVSPPQGGKAIVKADIKELLEKKGVKYGIIDSAIEDIVSKCLYNKEILIAKGTHPENGEDGRIEYLVETKTERKPQILDDGRADYHDMGFVQNISKGQELAKIIDPTKGKSGFDIFGKELPAKLGKKVITPKGKNVILKQGENVLVADIDGQISIQDGKISILPQIEINGNVDGSTGDIKFVGNVVVKGNVVTGFTVEAGGDLEIHGAVEGATIKAEGNVLLSKGVQGMNKASIFSGGDLTAKYIENASIRCKGNIKCDAIMHSYISCNGSLDLEGKKGLIVGGTIKVGGTITSKVIGSPMATLTEIEVGVPPEELDRFKVLKNEVAKVMDEIKKADQAVTLLNKVKANFGSLPKEKEEILLKAVRSKILMSNKLKELSVDMENMEEEISHRHEGKIKGHRIFPGVVIIIGNSKKFIKETIDNTMFYEESGEIRTGLL